MLKFIVLNIFFNFTAGEINSTDELWFNPLIKLLLS